MADGAAITSRDAAEAAWAARRLLRAARAGTLATAVEGQPYAALVTPATAPDVSPLLLLSGLSEHTRQLRAEPRCALLAAGPAAEANPQTAPRVTLTGLAEMEENPGLKARFLAIHPYAALYSGFGDFALWRIRPVAAMFVGGFARAVRLRTADLLPDAAAVAAVAGAEAAIMAHCNNDHPDALAAIARAAGGGGETWRMVAVDVDGCDLACEESALRIAWSAPVADPAAVRRELVRLAGEARGG